MAIIIKVGEKANQKKVKLELNARQSLSGDVMIFDHGDVDIVLSPTNKKVVVFPKETMSDLVYGAQNRLMSHLIKKGILVPESVQAGAFYGSMEGTIQDDELIHPDKTDSTELGEVPQATEKGSMKQSYIRDPYSLNYMYTFE